jgi:type IV secretion system protein VirD4
MGRDKFTEAALVAIGIPAVIWIGLLLAPVFAADKAQALSILSAALANPFAIQIQEGSARAVLLALSAYAFGVGIFYSTRRNWRRREEHGSAKWGDAKAIARRYRARRYADNKLLTKNFRMGFDGKRHKRNLNVMVVGGSGAGKTRGYCLPNVMQAASSLFVLDPKGEILRSTGHLLASQGYEIRVLDLIDPEKSHCYNPLAYLKSDDDVQRLSTNLFKATKPKDAVSQDPFWDTAAEMLHKALIFYLKYEAPPDEQTYPMVMEMLRAAEVREEDEEFRSVLDELFARLEMSNPDHIALKYYRDYRAGSAKTLKSIQITLSSRLEKFNLPSMISLTATDELDLGSLGEKKVALFARIPDNDTSYNFIVTILYTQLFQTLFELADEKYDGALPQHVHFLMDEFANLALPDDFEKILSVMRSRNISASIILQNLAQLKALFEKQHESIIGNCDSFLYLGGNEASTHEYVSKLLGKATIDTMTYGKTSGYQGHYNTNWQIAGRELLTPDEARMLDNRYALLFVRGERPIQDEKYNLLSHPRIHLCTDGGYEPFRHGQTPDAIATLTVESMRPSSAGMQQQIQPQPEMPSIEILSKEDVEAMYSI